MYTLIVVTDFACRSTHADTDADTDVVILYCTSVRITSFILNARLLSSSAKQTIPTSVMPRKQRRITLEVTDIDDTKLYYRLGYFSTFEELIALLSIDNAPRNPDCQYEASLTYINNEYKRILIKGNDTPASIGVYPESARARLLPRYDDEVIGPKRLIYIYQD